MPGSASRFLLHPGFCYSCCSPVRALEDRINFTPERDADTKRGPSTRDQARTLLLLLLLRLSRKKDCSILGEDFLPAYFFFAPRRSDECPSGDRLLLMLLLLQCVYVCILAAGFLPVYAPELAPRTTATLPRPRPFTSGIRWKRHTYRAIEPVLVVHR